MTDLKNDVTDLNKEASKLSDTELDTVVGGAGLLDTVVQVVKEGAKIVTGNTGKCTDHWYSE